MLPKRHVLPVQGSSAWTLVVVVALAAPVLFLGLRHGILRHGDEGRFVVLAREATQSGHWLVPTILGRPEVAKPPLYVWLIAGAVAAAGRLDEQVARLPGAFAALVASGALALLADRLAGWRAGLVAGLMFATASGPFMLSREVLPDMPMTASTVVAVLAAVIAWQERTVGAAVLFAAALALAVHFKLSAGLLPPVATVVLIALGRRSLAPVSALRPLVAVPVFLLVLSPWLVRFLLIEGFATEMDVEAGSSRLWRNWHGAVHALWRGPSILLEQAFPWAILAPAVLVHLWNERSRLRDDRLLVPVAWLLASLGMVLPVRSQRWRYLLPAVPALLVLVAITWDAVRQDAAGRLVRRLVQAPLAAGLVLTGLVGALTLAGLDPLAYLGAGGLTDLSHLPWVLLPIAWVIGGVAVVLAPIAPVVGGAAVRLRLLLVSTLAIALAGITQVSLHVLTAERRDRPVDPRPFAEDVRRVTAGRPIRFFGTNEGLASHFHVYLATPATLVDGAAAARALLVGDYLLVAVNGLPMLAGHGLPDAATRLLAEGRFGHYHYLLLVQEPPDQERRQPARTWPGR